MFVRASIVSVALALAAASEVSTQGGMVSSDDLVAAVRAGNLDAVKSIAARAPGELDRPDIYGWAPLHYAANSGNLAIVEWLIPRGIDLSRRDNAGRTPHNLAAAKGFTEVASAIARAGGTTGPARFPVVNGPYLGQPPPGLEPRIFAPGIVSSPDLQEMASTVSADGLEFYFYRNMNETPRRGRLFGCRFEGGRWSEPQEVAETAPYAASVPYLSRDGRRLYFWWNNPAPMGAMWMMDRKGAGWSEPTVAGPGMWLSSSRDGQLFATEFATGPDGRPTGVYLATVTERDGRYNDHRRLAIQPNFGDQWHPTIAPDGSYVIFDRGGDHMRVSFKRKDGTWGDSIDLIQHGFAPLAGLATISADGKYLFFKQGEPTSVGHDYSNRDLYWVDIRIIERLRPKEPI